MSPKARPLDPGQACYDLADLLVDVMQDVKGEPLDEVEGAELRLRLATGLRYFADSLRSGAS